MKSCFLSCFVLEIDVPKSSCHTCALLSVAGLFHCRVVLRLCWVTMPVLLLLFNPDLLLEPVNPSPFPEPLAVHGLVREVMLKTNIDGKMNALICVAVLNIQQLSRYIFFYF